LDSAETSEYGRCARGVSQNTRRSILGCSVIGNLEMAVGTDSTSMDNSFGDTLMIKAMNLLASNLVLEKMRPDMLAIRDFQPVK